MQSRNIKWALLFCTVLLIGSIIKDLDRLRQFRSNHVLLNNYLSFENIGLNHKKEILIDRIKTSIAFKSLREREKLSFITNLESSSSEELENQILKTLYPQISTLDSFPYNDDVFQLRNQKIEFSTPDILIFY